MVTRDFSANPNSTDDSIGAAERYGENDVYYTIQDMHAMLRRNARKKKVKSPKTTYPSK